MMANQCFVYFLARFGTLYRPIKAKICLKLGFYWKKIRKKTLEDGKLSSEYIHMTIICTISKNKNQVSLISTFWNIFVTPYVLKLTIVNWGGNRQIPKIKAKDLPSKKMRVSKLSVWPGSLPNES